MNKKLIPLLIVSAAFISACDQKAGTPGVAASSEPAVKKEDAMASINGQYISKSILTELEKEIAERSHGAAPNFPKEKLVEEIVQRELLLQDAVKNQLDKSPEFLKQMESARKAILTQAAIQDFIKKNPVTDAEVKAEYDKKVGGANATEYKARHILVKTEEEAKKIITALDKGGDFAKLANKNSLDAKESQNGGDLGWFSPSQMVAPFSEAVAKLEKGKYSKEPVKTQFGFHIILREDSRAQTPPPLDSVKDQLTPYLQRQKVQQMLENLRKQAKVEVLIPLEAPKAEPATPATPSATPAPDAAKPADAPAPAAADKAAATPTPVAPASVEPAKTAPAPAAEGAKK